MGSSPRLLLLIGTQHLDQGRIFEKHRDMYCCGAIVFLDAGFSPQQKPGKICVSVLHSPHQSSKAICVALACLLFASS